KKPPYPQHNAQKKIMKIPTKEIQNKSDGGRNQQCAMVMNQLLVHDHLKERVKKYLE
ncbi:IS256 family transposase, partial [Bacillus subtilis]|nr:IS256 family transposase [Bacillus subtilis]